MVLKLKKLNQQGMVSIIVTMMLIIVMSLIVLAMSRNSIREQRQSLDRQLSDQAFYNAESGVNDWVNYLYNNPSAVAQKTDCAIPTSSPSYPGTIPSQDLGTDGNNKYTCIMYNKNPQEIVFEDLGPGISKTIPLTPQDAAMRKLVITWDSSETNSVSSGCNLSSLTAPLPVNLPGSCNVGGLELNLVDTRTLDRASLSGNNAIFYLLPNNGGSGTSVALSSATGLTNQGRRVIATCTSGSCTVTIDVDTYGASGIPVGQSTYLNIKGLYLNSDITIDGEDVAGNKIKFDNAQYVIDVTGKSVDVLRRVQVRVPAANQFSGVDFALHTSENICKLIRVDTAGNTATYDTNSGRCRTDDSAN